jgi:RimJ/RimL family protein N-acetyltransferase
MEIFFTKARDLENDFSAYFDLKVDDANIVASGYTAPPDREKLRSWYKTQLSRADRLLFLARDVSNQTRVVGYLYIDLMSDPDLHAETGHGVSSKYGGLGIGTKIINFAINYCANMSPRPNCIVGWIADWNHGSIKNVLKNSYIKTDMTKNVFFEGLQKDVRMDKYIFEFRY